MLGWEFPPHISGGLGTACQGIARGLREADVDVVFVVPRVFGDEEPGDVRLVSAAEIRATPRRVPGVPPPRRAERRAVRVSAAVPGHTTVEIDSPLRPYDDARTYESRRRAAIGPGEQAWHEAPRLAQPRPAVAVGGDGTVEERPGYGLKGGYGPDLMSEVARYAEAVAAFAAQESFDVVHAHDWMTFPAGVRAREVSGCPLVVHAHALEHDRAGEGGDARIRAIERLGFEAADLVVCVSQYTAGLVQRQYGVGPERIRVVHNAVEPRPRVFRSPKAIEEPIVLFLGRITFQKGPEYFLKAAARVVERLPGVKFVMAGTGDMFPRMVEMAAEMGLAEHVHFTGFLRGADVERMFAMADVYIMPSVSEPFGIAPLEAMALDVPVVVSRQSGVAEVLTHALKVDFWDVDDLACKIVDVLTLPDLRTRLVQGGREELKQMQWSARGRHLRRIYEEVVS